MTALTQVSASHRWGGVLLIRLAVRRDRVMVPVWLAVLVLALFVSAAAVPNVYPTMIDRVQAAEAINSSPGIVALYGPILDVHSAGELAMTKMTVLYAVLVALMFLFVVRRHTRIDEENGQAELIGGTAISAAAPLWSAVTFSGFIALFLGVLAAAVNTAGGLPAGGSIAFGGSWAGTGLVAVGITAVACQLSSSARSCAGIAATTIGVLFLARAIGDGSGEFWLSWLSPFGWNTQLRAYSEPRWWVLLLYVSLAGVLVTVAAVLRSRRDLGTGLIAARPGPPTGSPRLADAIALNLRVQTPALVGWTVALAVWGGVFGAVIPSFDAFDSPGIQDMLARIGGEGSFRDTMIGAVLGMVGLIVTCFGIAVVVRGGSDEHDGRTEQVLSTATPRSRTFLATVLIAIAGATWLLLVVGVTLAVALGTSTNHSFGLLVASALAQAPAMWTVVALAVLFLAWGSRWGLLGWAAVVVLATLGQIGELLNLPHWVLDVSPYSHAPRMPLEDFSPVPALVLTGIAVLLLVGGWLRYRSRDIG